MENIKITEKHSIKIVFMVFGDVDCFVIIVIDGLSMLLSTPPSQKKKGENS